MNQNDLLYASHSAIQKALRRGDLDLAKTSFDIMWGDKTHRDWLRWRMPILVEEDACHRMGDFAIFANEVDKEDKQAWRKFTYELTLGLKSKDTEGLLYVSETGLQSNHPEIVYMRSILSRIKDGTGLVLNARGIMNDLLETREHSKYEVDAMQALLTRIGSGGMLGDRQACVACMVMITHRGLNQAEIGTHMQDVVSSYVAKAKRKPKDITIPWYCFDFHTAIGKQALGIFMKRKAASYGLNEAQVRDIWFMLESGYVPNNQIRYRAPFDKPTMLDTIWWPVWMKHCLTVNGKLPKYWKELWETELQKEIHGIINWVISKREF